MKRGLSFFFMFFMWIVAFTQPTKEELEAMQKKLQQIEKLRDSVLHDPKLNKALNTRGTNSLETQPAITASSNQRFSDKDFEKLKFPKKDTLKIRRISSRNFSPAELSVYLGKVRANLSKVLPADAISSANAIAQKLQNNPDKIENASLLALQNGAWEEALMLVTDAASRSPGDEIILTNAGAILDMSGLTENAIPVLRTVIRINPNNAIAFNNLGQAFTTIGMQDSALYYFSRCLSLSPQHPEANNTAGVIELIRGNKEQAQVYFENSIRGGFNVSAYKGLRYILKDKCRIAHLIKPKVKLPEYFNQFKFKLPAQCVNVQEAKERKEEQKNFRQQLSMAISYYQKLEKEAENEAKKKSATEMNKAIMEKAMKGERVTRPFQVLGGIMESETILAYNDDVKNLGYFNKENRRQYKQLDSLYKKDFEALQKKYSGDDDKECCGEGDISCCTNGEAFCRESNTLKNKYLPQFAQLNEEWQSRNLLIEKTHLDNLLYWGYFAAFNLDDFRVRFYQRVVNYLRVLQHIDEVKILEPCKLKEDDEEEKEKEDTIAVKEMNCPIGFSIRFWIGKLDGDCEKISFKAGDGIVFRYERNFLLRQQTISLGVGKDIDKLEVKALGLEGGVDFEATFAAYLTFDLQGNPMDGGLNAKLKGKAGVGFETGQKLKFKDGISLQAGINTGLSFEPGPLKPIWDKVKPVEEVPINKNVRLYNQN